MSAILVVDDDALVRSLVAGILRGDGHEVAESASGEAALSQLAASHCDLVITDLRMPGISGVELLERGRKLRPETRWVLITAFGTIANAVEAMRLGAADYVEKPLKSPAELRRVVARALPEKEGEAGVLSPAAEPDGCFHAAETLFLGERMAPVKRLVEEVAATSATVLVTGASGTGKELVARAIHELSPRRAKPFVPVHCAALTETLLESELFGHERGAFTGASATRKGRFELADGGTLFLDEIGELSQAVQVKLLRALQERQFERVGGSKPVTVDVRVISATNRDLKAEMSAGRFRSDLYYRLNVFPIALPPLAERRDAIPALAVHFMRRFALRLGRAAPVLSPNASSALLLYDWPGNVRELQNVMERAVILGHERIEAEHLNLETGGQPGGEALARERREVEEALARVGGHRQRAAELLGVSRRTLQYRLKKHGF